jgi:nucleotide-binding universal stress UspA family protein
MLPSYSSILAPVDFSPVSKQVLAHAVSLSKRFQATVHVLHTWETPFPIRRDLMSWSPEGRESLDRYAQFESERAMKALLEDTNVPLHDVTTEVRQGVAHETIVSLAGTLGADLIVMGTHGRTGVEHLLLGSVAEKVVRHASCPVMTIPTRFNGALP